MRFAVFAALLISLDTCPGTGPGRLLDGTWGGDNAAVIVTDGTIHVHIACTYGDAPVAVTDVAGGRFDVNGRYNITAHPVDLGVYHPAHFQGRIQGEHLTLSVRLSDTSVTLGPVRVTRGVEPKMGPCPICRDPGDRAAVKNHGARSGNSREHGARSSLGRSGT